MPRSSREAGIPEVIRTELSGLPVYWTTEAPEFSAGLMFRVGRADEPLTLRGITHLLEHLVSYAVYPGDDDVDATVCDQRTTFTWTGERDVVLERLRALAAALADPAPARIGDEVRVLRIEGDSPALHGQILRERFGAAGFGTGGWRQYALDWVGEAQLQSWVRRYIAGGNAGVWMTGEPPSELDLALPPGPWMAPPAAEAIPGMRLPAQRDFDDDGVAVSFVYELGLIYDIDEDYEPTGPRTAHAWLQADCLEEDAEGVRDELLALLEDLARDGPSAAELDRVRARRIPSQTDPWAASDRLEHDVLDELLGLPWRGPDLRHEALAAVTPGDVAEALRGALETRMVLAPTSLAAPDGFEAYDDLPVDPVQGTAYRASDPGSDERLVLGPDGVSWFCDGGPLTVRFARTCGALRTDAGGLELVERDGMWLEVDEGDWVDGASLLAAIEGALPAAVVMPARVR